MSCTAIFWEVSKGSRKKARIIASGASNGGCNVADEKGRDFMTGMLLLTFSLAMYFFIMPNQIGCSSVRMYTPPSLFPKLCLWGIALGGAGLMFRGRKVLRNLGPFLVFWPPHRLGARLNLKLMVLVLINVAYAFTLEQLGFLFSTGLVLALQLWLLGVSAVRAIAIISLAVPVCILLVFSIVLGVRLPSGFLPF